ncbi:MAG: biotin--[acetyl-CoA-carboxylase] ligase [Oscillospiraceae bacterium]|jgi:BirA family biotin operon repressor/biotin-[acetyl-CoA-carboxylase] ligase|nr:biotin--[acetyl-CoA-carboxylase] ligase [Oscillospiraceae bacterium]
MLSGLTTGELGQTAIYLPRVDSTNLWLKKNGADLPHGAICWTTRQTAGRGRFGREWKSAQNQALSMSLLIKSANNVSLLPLVCGMALCRALDKLANQTFLIKWPNDIICQNRKICGILCESVNAETMFVVAGIGVNLLQTKDTFKLAGLPSAGSVYMVSGRKLRAEETAAAILNELEPLWQTLTDSGFGALRSEYENKCITVGREVCVMTPDGEISFQGTAVGIALDGCLLVKSGENIVPVYAGEVTVRGFDGYI